MNEKLFSSRRGFIKWAAALGVSALVLVLGKPTVTEAKQPPPEPSPSGRGYRLTEHIKRYYETARL